MSVTNQVHGKFKLFTGKLGRSSTLGSLAAKVEAFVAEEKVAPKSIGVEFVESSGRLVLSLGYRDDEPGYEVALTAVSLGKVKDLAPAEARRMEKRMAEEGSKVGNVICHELFITDESELVMVFMAHRG